MKHKKLFKEIINLHKENIWMIERRRAAQPVVVRIMSEMYLMKWCDDSLRAPKNSGQSSSLKVG